MTMPLIQLIYESRSAHYVNNPVQTEGPRDIIYPKNVYKSHAIKYHSRLWCMFWISYCIARIFYEQGKEYLLSVSNWILDNSN